MRNKRCLVIDAPRVLKPILVTFVLVSLTASGGADRVGPDDESKVIDPRKAFAKLEQDWQDEKIESVAIVHVPTNRDYPVGLSSSRLFDSPTFRLIIYEP